MNRKTLPFIALLLFNLLIASAQAADNTYGPVRARDNLWSIAGQAYHDDDVTPDQAMLAILTANPQAFSLSCNAASYLKQGVTLQIPTSDAVRKRSPTAAQQAYRQQLQAWQASEQGGSPIQCPSPAPANAKATATLEKPAVEVSPLDKQYETAGKALTYTQIHQLLAEDKPQLSSGQAKTLLKSALNEHNMLSFAWALALALSVGIYLILDGADLGAGILSMLYNDSQTRSAIMASMASTWDANETWLVVAGGILFGGFPFVYGSVFSYLLLPLMVMLLAIILRAIALEFHHHANRSRRWWGWSFGIGSLFVAFSTGMAGGAVLDGVPLTTEVVTYAGGGILHVFKGSLFDFISPFSLWTGVVGVITALLAGSLYLRARFQKTCPLHQHVKRWVNISFYLLVAALLITGVWSYARFPWVAAKWGGSHPWLWGLAAMWIVFILYQLYQATRQGRDMVAMGWFALAIASILGVLGATLYPWLVPGSWTIYNGSDPSLSLVSFTLAMGGFIPVILVYNWYQLWVFRARISSMGTY